MDSLYRHNKRIQAEAIDCCGPPTAFGFNMSEYIVEGISSKIACREEDDISQLLKDGVLDHEELTRDASKDEEIDHSVVYCISYWHMKNNVVETQALVHRLSLGLFTRLQASRRPERGAISECGLTRF